MDSINRPLLHLILSMQLLTRTCGRVMVRALPRTWGVTGLKYRETSGNHMSKSCQNFQRRLSVAALCLVCTPVYAQDFRQTVVVTAAARPVELGSVTRTMTVITRQQIEALPVHSIADVLRLAS